MNLVLILVSPRGARNMGGILRLASNFGIDEIRVVRPRFSFQSLDLKKMAMHGYGLLKKVKVFETLQEAQADLSCTIGFSGRKVTDRRPFQNLYECARSSHLDDRMGLVFGREEWGLTLEELEACTWQVAIPTIDNRIQSSLNLTSAVAIALSAFFYQKSGDQKPIIKRREALPMKRDEEAFFLQLSELLTDVKFVNLQNPDLLMKDFRTLYHRAIHEARDLRIIFGVLSHIRQKLSLHDAHQAPAARRK